MSSVGEGEDEEIADLGKVNMKKRRGQRNRDPRKSQRDLGGPLWSLLTLGCTRESSGMLNKKINPEASSQASSVRTSAVGPGHCIYKSSLLDSNVQRGVKTADTGDRPIERNRGRAGLALKGNPSRGSK